MKAKLQILLLEDSLTDAELIAHELEASGFSFSLARVETESDFRQQLSTNPDLILSDHGLPVFDGFRALEIVRETRPELPFIFVSGSNSQQMIFEMHELGATDYVFKRDIHDLKYAVQSALMSLPVPATVPGSSAKSAATLSLTPSPFFPAVGVIGPAIDHLHFCPQCHEAWDEAGNTVLIEDYCGHHVETVVSCYICAKCGREHKISF